MRGAAVILGVMLVAGVAVSSLVASRRGADAERWRAELALAVEQGGAGDLARAQVLGRRLLVAEPRDREAAAGLAFANAVLALDYGVETVRDAPGAEAGTRVETEAGAPPADAISGEAAAARSLARARAGDREGAARQAAAAAEAAPGLPHPLYALGRARALAGDLPGAARALEAAIVGAPGFLAAHVARAEVLLDLGQPAAARAGLAELGARLPSAPADFRARLLLDEAERALGVAGAGTLGPACPGERGRAATIAPTPTTAAAATACALAEASRLRRSGARAAARARAEAAAVVVPDEPRLLARTAELLAQLGAVDRAGALLARARRRAAGEAPALAWAAVAVALGRGRTAALPPGPRPADPETRLIAARAALAAGGLAALKAALDDLGAPALEGDADLRALARLSRAPTAPTAAAAARAAVPGGDDPVRAYVDGLRMRLDGDLSGAAESLRRALAGHGDACRAAGEYVATLRALKRTAAPAAFSALQAENVACVNLR